MKLSLGQGRIRRLQSAIFRFIRHPDAATATEAGAADWNPGALHGRYCLLISYRADGTAVPTPVWFALSGDRVVVRTGADAYKIKRIRRTPGVLVVPSTSRGRPTGAAMLGSARVIDRNEEAAAEYALRARHGLLRRVYSTTVDDHLPTVYLEVGPRRAEHHVEGKLTLPPRPPA